MKAAKAVIVFVVLPVLLGAIYINLSRYASDNFGIDSVSDLVEHFKDEAGDDWAVNVCTPTTLEFCIPYDVIKQSLADEELPAQKEYWKEELYAFREFRRGDVRKAGEHWLNASKLMRRPGPVLDSPAGDERFCYMAADKGAQTLKGSFHEISLAKMKFDIEQLTYLDSKGLLPQNVTSLIPVYKGILAQFKGYWRRHPEAKANKKGSGTGIISLKDPRIREVVMQEENIDFYRLAPIYNRLVHMAIVPRVDGHAVNPDLDVNRIELDYFAHQPGFTYLDNLLVPEAMAGLQKLCLESTFWYEHKFGYVGAYMDNGFHSALLHQVAGEMQAKFSRVFRGAPLTGMWAYNYDSQRGEGIRPHADSAYVNVNFWITPDTANLDAKMGGLVVFLKGTPLEWSMVDAQNATKLMDYSKEHNLEPHTVPYRQNRMVFFNSNLVHYTDKFRFRKGHTERRINITMLFGVRSSDESHKPPVEIAERVAAYAKDNGIAQA